MTQLPAHTSLPQGLPDRVWKTQAAASQGGTAVRVCTVNAAHTYIADTGKQRKRIASSEFRTRRRYALGKAGQQPLEKANGTHSDVRSSKRRCNLIVMRCPPRMPSRQRPKPMCLKHPSIPRLSPPTPWPRALTKRNLPMGAHTWWM